MERASQMLIMCRSCGRQNRITRAPMGLRPVCGTRGCGATLPACVICGQPCESGGMLTSGATYHGHCHQRLAAEVETLGSRATELRNTEQKLATQLRGQASTVARVAAFFKREISPRPNIREQLAVTQRNRIATDQRLAECRMVLTRLYDYWLTYPPDWEQRRLEFLGSKPRCDICRSRKRPFHVHHRRPLSEGGSHVVGNLRALCEACHEKVHGGRKFTYEDDGPGVGQFAQKVLLLNRAMSGNLLINFNYTRSDGGKSVRCVRPAQLKRVESSLCLVGFCYLRHANRTFAVSRMTGLELTDSPGPCRYLRD